MTDTLARPDLLLLSMILAPWVGAVLAGLLPRYARNGAAALSWVVALVGLVSAILLYPNITDGPVRHEIRWMPSLGSDDVTTMTWTGSSRLTNCRLVRS